MATISSLGDGGNLDDFDKIPVARSAGTNKYILGKNISRQLTPPLLETGNVVVNNNDYNDRTVILNNGGTNITITLTPVVLAGLQVSFIRNGTGTVTFVPDTGVTIRTTPTPSFLKIAFQYSAVTAYYGGSNTWFIFGDLLT
jgi:hypothetical protein